MDSSRGGSEIDGSGVEDFHKTGSGKLVCGSGGMGGMSLSDEVLGGCTVSKYVSREGGGVMEGALLSARDLGDPGSSVTSLKPSRYMEMASSTLIPPSNPYGASGVSGDRSVIELLLVSTLLRSVPLCCSMLDREVRLELTLVRRVLSSAGPLGGKRGSGRPWGPSSWRRSGDS